MTYKPEPKRPTWTAEQRARQSKTSRRVWERMRRRAAQAPEWERLLKRGAVHESMREHVLDAMGRGAEIEEALGGEHRLSPQRRALLRQWTRLEGAASGLSHEIAVRPDPELASRLGTVSAQQRQTLMALGLDVAAAEEIDLRSYLERKRPALVRDELTSTRAIDTEPEHEPADAEIVAQSESGAASEGDGDDEERGHA